MSSTDKHAEARQEFLRVASELSESIVNASSSQLAKGFGKGVTKYEIGIGVSGFVERVLLFSDGDTQVAEELVSTATELAEVSLEKVLEDQGVGDVVVRPDEHSVPVPGRDTKFVVNAFA